MKSMLLVIALLFGGIVVPAGGGLASDAPGWRAPASADKVPAFPRSSRAQAIWDSGACWSECGSRCAWGLAMCLTQDTQGNCLTRTDSCDRACQRQCRTRGGPYVPLD